MKSWRLYKNNKKQIAVMIQDNGDGTMNIVRVKWSNEKNTWVPK